MSCFSGLLHGLPNILGIWLCPGNFLKWYLPWLIFNFLRLNRFGSKNHNGCTPLPPPWRGSTQLRDLALKKSSAFPKGLGLTDGGCELWCAEGAWRLRPELECAVLAAHFQPAFRNLARAGCPDGLLPFESATDISLYPALIFLLSNQESVYIAFCNTTLNQCFPCAFLLIKEIKDGAFVLDAKCGPQKSHFSPGTMSEGLLQPLISDLVHSRLAWSPPSTISCPLLTVRHYFSSQGNWQRSYNFFPKRVIRGSEPSGLFCESRAAVLLWFWSFPSFLHVWPVLLMASS